MLEHLRANPALMHRDVCDQLEEPVGCDLPRGTSCETHGNGLDSHKMVIVMNNRGDIFQGQGLRV